MKIKAFIVEDQKEEYYSLSKMLEDYHGDYLVVVSNYLTTQPFDEATQAILIEKPDLLFVDYDLQEGAKNGLALCRKVVNDNMFVIFFSRIDEAKKSSLKILQSRSIPKNPGYMFSCNILSVQKDNTTILLKEDLDEHVQLARLFFQKRDELNLVVTKLSNSADEIIPISKVIAIRSYGRYSKCFIEANPGVLVISKGLKEIQTKYSADVYSLSRCHNEWIINSTKVYGLEGRKGGGLKFLLEGDNLEKIPIGETYEGKPEIIRILDRFS